MEMTTRVPDTKEKWERYVVLFGPVEDPEEGWEISTELDGKKYVLGCVLEDEIKPQRYVLTKRHVERCGADEDKLIERAKEHGVYTAD